MGFLPVDQITTKEHQQMAQAMAQKQAKTASPVSVKKVLVIALPIFLAALALILFLCGAFDKGYTIRWNDSLYRIPHTFTDGFVDELPEGYGEAGSLVFAEDPQKTKENGSSNWTMEAKLYVRQTDDGAVYITWGNGYLKAKKK